MGHLEACAAAAGLASLMVMPLLAGVVSVNAQLRLFVSFLVDAGVTWVRWAFLKARYICGTG